jgi:RNA polymerase sigma-70 factor (ECF subfamily)
MKLSECASNRVTLPNDWKHMDDGLLVAAAQAGDCNAFGELERRYSGKIVLKAYRITRNWQDAEDVGQESMMKAFTHLHTFERRSQFSTWLTRIAINSSIMLLRKRRRSLEATIDMPMLNGGEHDSLEFRDKRETPEQSYARSQTEAGLREAILRIRPKNRTVVELSAVGGLSIAEIARYLSVSIPTVKSRLMRARKEIRHYL